MLKGNGTIIHQTDLKRSGMGFTVMETFMDTLGLPVEEEKEQQL